MSDTAKKECFDCQRVMPLSDFQMVGNRRVGRCRICYGLFARAGHPVMEQDRPVIELPVSADKRITCSMCKGRKTPSQAYCAPCMASYARARRSRNRLLTVTPQTSRIQREEMKDMPGVDIDAIHYKRRAVKRKKAA